MDEYIEKHLYDVLLSIEETESYFEGSPSVYQDFEKDILRQRAVERNVEIMGEAINRILKIDPISNCPTQGQSSIPGTELFMATIA